MSIIFLIMLTVSIYIGINSSIDKLESSYYHYLKMQNVEDISIDVNLYNKQEILDNLKEKYDFEYEYELSKILINKDIFIKIIPYIEENKINKPYLLEGKIPSNNNEITMLKNYAIKNNLKIGDKYKLNDKEYKIVGFTYASDYIYPLISFSMPIFDEEKNNIIFMNKKEYELINGIDDNSYAIKYNKNFPRGSELKLNENGNLEDKTGVFSIFNEAKISYNLNTITRLTRISSPIQEIESNRLFADYLLTFLLSICSLTIIIITKKKVESERSQIGILKSLGYNCFSITISYLTYSIVGSLIGGILGFILGIFISNPLTNVLVGVYNIPIVNNNINFEYLKFSLLIPTLILSILSYLVTILMLKKRPLELIKEGSNLKINIFSRIVSKITIFFKFERRLKLLLAFRSFGKLILISIISFCTGMLITLILICLNLFENLIEKSFEGMKYKYLILYDEVINREEKFELGTDYILEKTVSYLNEDITIIGTDIKNNYLELYDENKKNIINLLNQDGIIISKNMSEQFNVKKGDKLKFKYQNIEFEYEVLGINNELIGFNVYVRRESLSNKLGFNNSYNTIYSNDDKYNKTDNINKLDKVSYVLNLNSLKDNIMKQIDIYNKIIYIVIIFATIITFIIIVTIANIVIEENKKSVSLMKVIGYDDKKISNIVLNIYIPFIIISYLLSIFITTKILEKMFSILSSNIEMTIPVNIDFFRIIIGLIILLIVYYIAISISKKKLNKVPLSVALKRE